MAYAKRVALICIVFITGIIIIPTLKSGYYFIKALKAFNQRFEGVSVRYLEKSIHANRNFLEAYLLLAFAYREWGSSSLHYIEHDKAGLVKLKSETIDRAENVLKSALIRFPYHCFKDDIQYMLGKIYDQDARNPDYTWDKNKAIYGYEQLISQYPTSRYVWQAKKRIEALSK